MELRSGRVKGSERGLAETKALLKQFPQPQTPEELKVGMWVSFYDAQRRQRLGCHQIIQLDKCDMICRDITREWVAPIKVPLNLHRTNYITFFGRTKALTNAAMDAAVKVIEL